MSASALPFDDVRALIGALPGPDEAIRAAVRAREAALLKPPGALGRLEAIAEHVAVWQGRAPPRIERPLIAVFAASHGVAARGVSAYPPEIGRNVLDAIAAGGAAICQFARAAGAGLKVFDLALDTPTPDIVEADALDERACVATMAFGMEALAEGCDLLVLGEVGIGNTTIAAAMAHALYGGAAADWTGPGSGVSGAALGAKVEAVAAAVARCAGGLDDGLEVLRRLGGREFAAMAGAILAARQQRAPVILDGYAATMAAAVLHAVDPDATAHCIAGHASAEPAHRAVLDRMGLAPVLDLGMRLGEGTGGAVALQVVKAAAAAHAGMATFAQAGAA
jgi:nicotinate-nucleotide--dimethylbenzimidazole phosphoribosyltransferase